MPTNDPRAVIPGSGFQVSQPVEYVMSVQAASEPIISIDHTGRIFWKGREVETDDDFRAAMLDLLKYFRTTP